MNNEDLVDTETLRIRLEYERRERELDGDLYAPWQPGEMFMVAERERLAALALKKVDKFPAAGDRCLELGYGKLGWLGRMITWGLGESDLYGMELDHDRATIARNALPNADLRIGNAVQLPWQNDYFQIVVVSTLFSSILEGSFRSLMAREIDRVLMSGGVVLWYDAAVDNPRNNKIKGIPRSEVVKLFPSYDFRFMSVTLAPPISRKVAKFSWTLATLLSTLPFLRTHLLGVLIKP